MFQMKQQGKTPEKELKTIEINNLPDIEFKVIILRVITIHRSMDEQKKNFNKEIEENKKKQPELKIKNLSLIHI